MSLKTLLVQLRPQRPKIIVSFGGAHLLRDRNGHFELRGGSREERQAAREWVAFFQHEAAVEW